MNDANQKDFDYKLGKLYEKENRESNISYFKNIFRNDSEIIEELENMEVNLYNNLEYYCSYEYLTYLISNKNKA
jgi:hypothetical protein